MRPTCLPRLARLRQCGPLQREAELALFQRLERAEVAIGQALLGSRVAIAHFGATARGLRSGRIRLGEVTRRSVVDDEEREVRRAARILERIEDFGDVSRHGEPGANRVRTREQAERAVRELRPCRALLEGVLGTLRARPSSDGSRVQGGRCTDGDALGGVLAAAAIGEREVAEVRAQLVEGSLGLVCAIARVGRCDRPEVLDLVQEGTIGLMHAIDRFDHDRGYRLSTYASARIRERISLARDALGRTIRLPPSVLRQGRAIGRARREVEQARARPATVEEIAVASGLSEEAVSTAMGIADQPRSLDAPAGNDAAYAVGDPDAELPFDIVASKQLADGARELLASLTDREQIVLRMRFGFDGASSQTLEEIGRGFSLTRERIRQIESGALRKLREPALARRLRQDLQR